MSGFKALNIESDDESDIEIDDTKEIQIEEALKLYQNALKYHSEGPSSYENAAHAYEQLFESEVFKYPESQPELRRIELYGPVTDADADDFWDESLPDSDGVVVNFDSGPSTLPQILHLSHKNYAQFKLDALAARFDLFTVTLKQILADAKAALSHFVQALDKDDNDLDLWRRTASVGEILDSRRIARFCLEAILDSDDDGVSNLTSLPGLEEGFACEHLRELVTQLQDQLSLLQTPLLTTKRKLLSRYLKRQLHHYDDILQYEATAHGQEQTSARTQHSVRVLLKAPTTWAELGDTLLRQLMSEQHGTSSTYPGLAIAFDFDGSVAEPLAAVDATSNTMTERPQYIQLSESALPSITDEQFPGLDNGQPTAQPQIASADASMQVTADSPDIDVDMKSSTTMVLPSRKRSGDAAGLGDNADEVRTKSRRIRARDSTLDTVDSRQAVIDANTQWEYEQQLNEFQAADDWMFETVGNFFEKIGIVHFDAARYVRQEMVTTASSTPSTDPPLAMRSLKHARSDLQAFLDNFSDQQAQILLHGGDSFDVGQQSIFGTGSMFAVGTTSKSMSKITQIPDDGVVEFLQSCNKKYTHTQNAAFKFVEVLLRPGTLKPDSSTYMLFLWPESLKTMVVRILVNFDGTIHNEVSDMLAEARRSRYVRNAEKTYSGLAEFIQAIFELHLDIYSLIKQPNSGVESHIVIAQGDRLQRWFDLARESVQSCTAAIELSGLQDPLNIRFLWATAFHLSVSSDIAQEHVIECLTDLRKLFSAAENSTIILQNNAVMPELSLSMLDHEISKLTTRDFFLKVTNQDMRDPAGVIESLEPLLEALDNSHAADCSETLGVTVAPELVKFLESSNMAVRLLLWQRLRDAYSGIEYSPMVFRCHLRIMRMILEELKSAEVSSMAQTDRQSVMLRCLRMLQDTLKNLFDLLQNSKDALECMDETTLKVAVNNFGEVLQLLQVFNVAEDSIRVGQSHPPTLTNGLPVQSFQLVTKLIHDMQIYLWIILYAFFKEAISQNGEVYSTPLEDRFDFLRTVHRNLGIRGICGALDRVFVKMLKDEFVQMTPIDGYESELAQVFYDLYRLNCFLNPSYELIEHKCGPEAFLDRPAGYQALDLLLAQADKVPIKELIKHPLKDAIDKLHGTLPRKKPKEAILRNREIYRAFLRSPIVPLDLFGCIKGEGSQLPTAPVLQRDAILAAKGWYFLMGSMSLTRFRSQKRSGPTPTEDLEIAIAFFMQDLEYTAENWETWFRLAQAYDTKIEESVVWSADKMNSEMPALITLQRHAIHCYIMATAQAHRAAELSFESSSKMMELYYDFANRLYSSARKPFDMQAFKVDDADRFVSITSGVKQQKAFLPLRGYTTIKFANLLFQRALPGKPDNWMVHHMIGKCLWKMHSAPEHERLREQVPPAHRVLQACRRALELLPDKDKKDSRDSKKEPTLEPHYKLVSVVHKLLTETRSISLVEAKEALNDLSYAKKEPFPQSIDGWPGYILLILKQLRAADKSNWYHRMIYRTAKIIYERTDMFGAASSDSQNKNATGAKHELTQQMFTKTMVLQVWRPESERPGRHFVYTATYTRFFVQILKQLRDRQGLEQLARRVRRRLNDVFEHALVWQDICNAYLQLLREHANVAEGLETAIFSNFVHEEFLTRKEPLERWMQAQETGEFPALDALREVQELKKINQSLMKTGAIDDLIGDTYAHIFNTVGRQLWDDERRAKQEEENRREQEKPQITSPARNPVMAMTHLINIDGNSNEPPRSDPHKDVVVPPASEAVLPSRRKVGVGRREIRACAEGCFQKAKPQTNEQSLHQMSANAPQVQVLIERRRLDVAGEASVETSAPGSIHDSADDESELSELEEADDEADDDERRPLFPNLVAINSQGQNNDGSDEEEEDETAEGDAEQGQDDVQMDDGEDNVTDRQPATVQESDVNME